MSPAVAAASQAAWNDEVHVRENRAAYAAKFTALQPRLAAALPCPMPEAAFYLWAATPGDDAEFARRLYAEQAVTVLPGSYLGREAHGANPGRGRVRIALVAPLAECAEAVDRIRHTHTGRIGFPRPAGPRALHRPPRRFVGTAPLSPGPP